MRNAISPTQPSTSTATACRILRIEATAWDLILTRYKERFTSDLAPRIALLQELYADVCPHRMPVPGVWETQVCPVCAERKVEPLFARKPDMVIGACSSCGHGVLLAPPLDPATYNERSYYERQLPNGAGYPDYRAERAYREAKARRLLEWAAAAGCRAPGRFLEIGSGFGFTRKAAEHLGWVSDGVDLNPFAGEAARDLYGFETFAGSLQDALEGGAIPNGIYDLVLYQFVLEHVPDPLKELRFASRLLSPNGRLFLLVPSIEALEFTVFGASYRSVRADHLHLFTWRSVDLALGQAGLRRERSSTECGVHLLSPFLSAQELEEVYQQGFGPDMLILARREES